MFTTDPSVLPRLPVGPVHLSRLRSFGIFNAQESAFRFVQAVVCPAATDVHVRLEERGAEAGSAVSLTNLGGQITLSRMLYFRDDLFGAPVRLELR
jgi:hypothetical protein